MKKIFSLLFLLTVLIISSGNASAGDSFVDLMNSQGKKKLYIWVDSGNGVFYLSGIIQKATESYIVLKKSGTTYYIKTSNISYISNKR